MNAIGESPSEVEEPNAEAGRALGDTGLEQLLERLRPRLRRYVAALLHRRLCRRMDASDVVQDAYAQAARHVQQLSELSGESLCRELVGIARGRTIDSYRRHVRAARRSVLREVPDRARSDDSIGPILHAVTLQ